MKTKQLRWEVVLFAFVNLIEFFGEQVLTVFIMVGVVASFLGAAGASDSGSLLSFLVLIIGLILGLICILYLILKNFFITFVFKLINKKGSEKYKCLIQKLRKSFSLQLRFLLIAFLLDLLHITALSAYGYHYDNELQKSFFNFFSYHAKFCLLGGSLTLPYLTTFILWQIGDWVKKIRCKNV